MKSELEGILNDVAFKAIGYLRIQLDSMLLPQHILQLQVMARRPDNGFKAKLKVPNFLTYENGMRYSFFLLQFEHDEEIYRRT